MEQLGGAQPSGTCECIISERGNNFHPHSPPDKPSKTRSAVVASPQVRQLKHKPERRRPSPSEGLKPVPSLPHSSRFWGRGADPARLGHASQCKAAQCSPVQGSLVLWDVAGLWLLPTQGGKGWQEQQASSADSPTVKSSLLDSPCGYRHPLPVLRAKQQHSFAGCSHFIPILGELHLWVHVSPGAEGGSLHLGSLCDLL